MKNFWDHQTFKSFKHGFKNTQDVYSYLCPNVYPIFAPRFTPRFTHCFIGLSMDIARLRVLPKVADWLTQSSALNFFLWFDRSWHHPGLLTLMWYWLGRERSVRPQQVLETHRFSQGGKPGFPAPGVGGCGEKLKSSPRLDSWDPRAKMAPHTLICSILLVLRTTYGYC